MTGRAFPMFVLALVLSADAPADEFATVPPQKDAGPGEQADPGPLQDVAPLQEPSGPPKTPATVDPVVWKGIEYRVAYERYRQNGGPSRMRAMVEARDAKSKEALWRVQVYDVRYRKEADRGEQDGFIKDLKFDQAMTHLIATDNRGRRFFVDPRVPFLLAPPKPEGATLARWFDSEARRAKPYRPTTDDAVWMLFRKQVSYYDRLRIERVQRQGNTIIVTPKHEWYAGRIWANPIVDRILTVELGKLPAGDYTVKWVINMTAFGPGFEGARDAPASDSPPLTSVPSVPWTLLATRSFTVAAASHEAGSGQSKPARLAVTILDAALPCGVGRVQKNAVWNEPYRYRFRDVPACLANAQHVFMRQNGGGATGRWLKTGQVDVSQACWFFAAVHQPSAAQREIWTQEGWEILPDLLSDLGDARFAPQEVRTYVLMRKRIQAGPVNFDSRAEKTPMVIWMFKELEPPHRADTTNPPQPIRIPAQPDRTCGNAIAPTCSAHSDPAEILQTTPRGRDRLDTASTVHGRVRARHPEDIAGWFQDGSAYAMEPRGA